MTLGVIVFTIDATRPHLKKMLDMMKIAFDKAGEWELVLMQANPATFKFTTVRNLAFKALSKEADPIFSLPDDYFLHEDDVLTMLSAKADLVQPQLYLENWQHFSSGANLVWENDLPCGCFIKKEITEETPCGYADTMIRREVIEKVGGFFEGYSYYYGDVDFSNLATRLGYKVSAVPTKTTTHPISDTLNRKADYNEKAYQDAQLYIKRWHPLRGELMGNG